MFLYMVAVSLVFFRSIVDFLIFESATRIDFNIQRIALWTSVRAFILYWAILYMLFMACMYILALELS